MPDLVVLGGGFAGLIAANRAAELGCSVVVLEAGEGTYLCNSRIATGAMNFAHSDPQLPPEQLVQAIMEDTEDYADPSLAAAIAEVAGRGLQWLQDNGAQFVRKNMQGKNSWVLSPPRILSPGLDWRDRGADLFLGELEHRLKLRGGVFHRGTRGRELILIDGRLSGVLAQKKDQVLSFQTPNVLIADGGFQASVDMVREYICAKPEDLVQRNSGAGFGDGIRMALAIGAEVLDMNRFYGHLLSRDALNNDLLWPYPTLDSLTGGGILIGGNGCRIFDEGLGGISLSNSIAELQNPLSTWVIFDEEIWSTTGKDEVVPCNPHYVEAGGTLFSASTIYELAQKTGLPVDQLDATIASYNLAVSEGREQQLLPPRSPGRRFGVKRSATQRIPTRQICKPPFYAIPVAAGISFTMGGLAIDAKARVKQRGGGVIPGLFAAGDASAGLMGGPIAGYIGGLSTAYCTALIAAETLACRD